MCARRAAPWLAALAIVLLAPVAAAHKASDSYLQLRERDAGGIELRWDIALRDLDESIEIDADGDARITWAEVKAAWPAIEAHALRNIAIDGCALKPQQRGLERRGDGAYAVLWLQADCPLRADPVVRYSLFRETDPTHRGLLRIELAGLAPALLVLDPSDGRPAMPDEASPTDGPGVAEVSSFLLEGVRHIVGGYDHVLFLLCLLLPAVMRRMPGGGWQPVAAPAEAVWPIVGVVTAFTVAHALTLTLAALGLVSLPAALIEPAIAVTIILAALDNLWPILRVPRVVVAFGFGLIHGFGFANVIAELDLPAASFAWALLQFNLGLEIGQLAIVAAATGVLLALRRLRGYPRWVIGGGSLAAALVATVWLVERTADLSLLPL